MNLLVSHDGSQYARAALRDACRMAGPTDTIFVMTHVRAPALLPLHLQDDGYFKRRWRAGRLLAQAGAETRELGHYSASIRGVQVEAPTASVAVCAAAGYWSADRIVMAIPSGWRGQLALLLRPTLHMLLHHAPCVVQFTVLRPQLRCDPAGSSNVCTERLLRSIPLIESTFEPEDHGGEIASAR